MKKTGIVSWFNDSKGYGIITDDSDKVQVFVHYSAISGPGFKTLAENQRVEFERIESVKGPQAVNVVKGEILPLESEQ